MFLLMINSEQVIVSRQFKSRFFFEIR